MEWIIGLLVAGLILVLAEVFIPGGVLGAIGGVCMLIGVVLAFMRDVNLGFGVLVGAVVFGGLSFWLWIKYFPATPLGRKMLVGNDAGDWHGYETKHAALLGKTGVAYSMLRPSGIGLIDGERVDVVAQGQLIEKDDPIVVIDVQGNRVIVAVDEEAKKAEQKEADAERSG